MRKTYNLMFAGVGGQGSLFVAELTSLTAMLEGYDVKQSEVHGVSQRGGSVETHVRFGQVVNSPIVTPGEADAVIGLEKLEALRFAHFVAPGAGRILVNDYEIIPASVADADSIYPHHALDHLRQKGLTIIAIPASEIARGLGDGRMANVVMLGALSDFLPFKLETWQQVLERRLPPNYRQGNLLAFEAGRQIIHATPETKGV